MSTYLITGSSGFIGSHLVKTLELEKDTRIFMSSGDISNSNWGPVFSDLDYIYHLAGTTDTRDTSDIEVYRNNINCFLSVLNLAMKTNAKLIYASSAQIYGNAGKQITAYSVSKLAIEKIAEFYFDKLKIVGLRLSNVFGPNEFQKGKMASMITRWAHQIKTTGKPIAFKNSQAVRDFIYVKDVVSALLFAREKESGFYDVGSGKPVSFEVILDLVRKILKHEGEIEWIDNPYKDAYQIFTQAKLNWGFQPRWELKDAIEYYLLNYPNFYTDDFKIP